MGKLKKLDKRIQIVLKNGIRLNQRTMFVMVGNKGQNQVPIMYQILHTLNPKGISKILWCYKNELGFSTYLSKKRKAGIVCEGTIFEQFICSTDIRWCYYDETHTVLGQTFDMCVLQDFEALTPNTIARTIETVSGGGLVVFLLKSMDSLNQLKTMVMDVHARYRTEAHTDIVCRFNERFILSLAQNKRCLVLDDLWRILNISKRSLKSMSSEIIGDSESMSNEKAELRKLKLSMESDNSPFSPLIQVCVTLDQTKCLLQACAAVSNIVKLQNTKKNLKSIDDKILSKLNLSNADEHAKSAVVVVTASRGRGKSAALGLSLSAAIEAGLPNLYVTAPSPENVSTLMEFFIKGLKALSYEEHIDFNVVRSKDPSFNNAVINVEVFRRSYRQSLVYLQPWEAVGKGTSQNQADLICIDEAAAIPLPIVKQLTSGPRLVFMASTINGYEGTGRSLSIKLIKELKKECQSSSLLGTEKNKGNSNKAGQSLFGLDNSKLMYECQMEEAIRYSTGDPIEAWLNQLLCLDCESSLYKGTKLIANDGIYPPVDRCELYYINRDTLFAYHKSTEVFLQRIMALYVSSHYKNTPNDLQMLSDAPAHHLFCLMPPYDPASNRVPEILCVIQVCFEGQITKDIVSRGLSRGLRPSGDLIPWTLSQQFCDSEFGSLSGGRVIRIATHPDYQGIGYGSKALKLLAEYFEKSVDDIDLPNEEVPMSVDCPLSDAEEDEEDTENIEQIINNNESDDEDDDQNQNEEDASNSKLLNENITQRKSLPPLLSRLSERKAEKLDYLGVCYGATPSLLRFWKKAGFVPVYLRQSINQLTGEFSTIMLKALNDHSSGKQLKYHEEFRNRFMSLSGGPFRCLDASFSMEFILNKATSNQPHEEITKEDLKKLFSRIDITRLKRYCSSLVDFHVISDLIPKLAELYFAKKLTQRCRINQTQKVILYGMGLQRKTVETLAKEFHRVLGPLGSQIDKGTASKRSSSMAYDESALLGVLDGKGQDEVQHSEEYKKSTSSHKDESTEWTKRVRGLLFVIVKELADALEEAIADSDEENDPDDLAEGEGLSLTMAEATELVNEMGANSDFRIKGSKEDWVKATSVLGGNLKTACVQISEKKKILHANSKKRGRSDNNPNSRSAKFLKMQNAERKKKRSN